MQHPSTGESCDELINRSPAKAQLLGSKMGGGVLDGSQSNAVQCNHLGA